MKRLKRTFAWILALLLLTAACADADTCQDARSRITIYDQHHEGGEHNEYCGIRLSEVRMHADGCLIFSLAHAIQWTSGVRYENQAGVDLITDLISPLEEFGNPPKTSSWKYFDKLEKYGCCGSLEVPGTAEEIRACLDEGNAILLCEPAWESVYGHYVIAVGYTFQQIEGINQDDFLIQIVDSSVDTTVNKFRSQNYLSYEFRTFEPMLKEILSGGQYWISYDVYRRLNQRAVICPVKNTASPYEEAESMDVPEPSEEKSASGNQTEIPAQSDPQDKNDPEKMVEETAERGEIGSEDRNGLIINESSPEFASEEPQ